jgi:hypothetical protein
MKRSSYAAILLLAFATAYAISGRAQTGTPATANSTQQPSQPSQPSQSGVVTPAQPTVPAGAQQPSSTSSNQNSANTNQNSADSGQSNTSGPSNQVSNSDLTSRITAALHNDPDLAGSNVSVNVSDTTVELNGSVSSGTAKTSANRLARSYAMNRQVKDNITVVPRTAPAVSTQPNATAQQPAGSPPITQPNAAQPKNPNSKDNPQQKGDASDDPRKPH